jgi:hypothetical protein
MSKGLDFIIKKQAANEVNKKIWLICHLLPTATLGNKSVEVSVSSENHASTNRYSEFSLVKTDNRGFGYIFEPA